MLQKETLRKQMQRMKTAKRKKKPPYDDSPLKVRMFIEAEHGDEEIGTPPKENTDKSEADMFDEDDIFASLNGSGRREHFRFEANRRYFTICVYAFFFVIAAALVVFGIMNMTSIKEAISRFLIIMTPFIMGAFISFLINPMVRQIDTYLFQKLFHMKSAKARKVLSILLSYILVIGAITVIFLYVVPQIVESLSDLTSRKDALYDGILYSIDKLETYLPAVDSAMIGDKINELLPNIITYLSNLITELIPFLLNFSFSIAKFALNLLLSVAISIYILYDLRKLKRVLTRLVYAILPIRRANSLTDTVKECGTIFAKFIVGKSIDSLIIGVLCFIILKIFDFPYAVLVSVIVGITNMIPYFGPFIGAVPGIILYLCIGFGDALGFGIIILALQQFDGWVLGPKILGDSTGLSPIWVIFAIIVGGAYAGVIGMFLGVPVVAVVAYLSERVISGKLKKKKLDIS